MFYDANVRDKCHELFRRWRNAVATVNGCVEGEGSVAVGYEIHHFPLADTSTYIQRILSHTFAVRSLIILVASVWHIKIDREEYKIFVTSFNSHSTLHKPYVRGTHFVRWLAAARLILTIQCLWWVAISCCAQSNANENGEFFMETGEVYAVHSARWHSTNCIVNRPIVFTLSFMSLMKGHQRNSVSNYSRHQSKVDDVFIFLS